MPAPGGGRGGRPARILHLPWNIGGNPVGLSRRSEPARAATSPARSSLVGVEAFGSAEVPMLARG